VSRSERRAETKRVKANFRRSEKQRRYWGFSVRNAGLFANHGKVCSCYMCGNPRRHFGIKTMDEAVSRIEMAEGLSEV